MRRLTRFTLFPYTTLFRSVRLPGSLPQADRAGASHQHGLARGGPVQIGRAPVSTPVTQCNRMPSSALKEYLEMLNFHCLNRPVFLNHSSTFYGPHVTNAGP